MFMFYDFYCTECGLTTEGFESTETTEIPCACEGTARRILSAVRIDRTRIACSGSSASPESIAHFDRVHQQQKTIEERNLANHGDVGKMPGSD